jgi:hypothetical protein
MAQTSNGLLMGWSAVSEYVFIRLESVRMLQNERSNFPEPDFWPGITSGSPVIREESGDFR